MSPFQSNVRVFQTTGLPGELANEGPLRSSPWTLDSSVLAVPNNFGFAFTKVADERATVGGGGAFLGFLVRPKEATSFGTGASALDPVNALPDFTQGELLSMGIIFINLATAGGDVGDGIFYNDLTGALDAGVAGAGETQIANAEIIEQDIPAAGLAKIKITQ